MLYPTRNTVVGFMGGRLIGGAPSLSAQQALNRRSMFTQLPKTAAIPDGYAGTGAMVLPYTAGQRVSWIGNEGVSSGVATGASGRNGTADGAAVSTGLGTGVATFDGSAAGASVSGGVATGIAVASGAATGASTSTGATTGFAAIDGSAAGASVSAGAGDGIGATSAPGSGAATSAGTAAGYVSFNGAATGAGISGGVASGLGIAIGAGVGNAVGAGLAGGFATFEGSASGSATSIGVAPPGAIAWGSASTVTDSLSPSALAAAVWSALASGNNVPGTMGDLLNSAGGGGISGAVIDQIADAVWDWADAVAPGSKGEELAKALKAAKLAAALSA